MIAGVTQKTELSSGYILNYKTEKCAEQFSQLKAEIEKIVKDLADYNVTLTFATIPPVLLSKFLPILATFSTLRNLKMIYSL